ncbi:hypothetical protein [Croceicoccus marinus]|nr:hypothetical protein [Croceicoccus marinus]
MIDWLIASDAGHWTMLALGALLLAIVAWLGDWRRARRARPDAVGCMPWTAVFMAALLVAVVAGSLALLTWLSP